MPQLSGVPGGNRLSADLFAPVTPFLTNIFCFLSANPVSQSGDSKHKSHPHEETRLLILPLAWPPRSPLKSPPFFRPLWSRRDCGAISNSHR
jgi:hypothetical protein